MSQKPNREDAADRLIAELDLLRALVKGWGNMPEGSVTQATAIRNSGQVMLRLLGAANTVIDLNNKRTGGPS